jgi:LysM repeat protein
MNAMRAAVLPRPSAGNSAENSAENTENQENAAPLRPGLRLAYSASAPAHPLSVPTAPAQPAPVLPVAVLPVAVLPAPVLPVAARPVPTTAPETTPLRLTRRGRVVVAVMAALLVAVVSLIAARAAQATGHSAPGSGTQNLAQVVVHPGQSLWSVAQSADPDADPRVVIQQIVQLNALSGDTVFAGQRLWVPRS